MNKGVLALFVRSMREDSRRILPYAARVALVLLVLLVVAISQQVYRFGGGAAGLRVFSGVTWLNFGFLTLIGLTYFASAITEEKEDGTLGLLRMTNLNPVSILLGKSTSRLIAALLLMAAQLPFTMLAVSLGGISMHQVLNTYLVMAAYAFLLCNLALVFSVICRRTASAAAMTVVVLLTITFGWMLFMGFTTALFDRSVPLFQDITMWLLSISPTTSLMKIFNTGFDEVLVYQPASNVVIGLVLFGISWAVFDVFNQGEGRGGARPKQAVTEEGVEAIRLPQVAKPRPGSWAVTWRDFYFYFGGLARQIYILALILAVIVLICVYVNVTSKYGMSLDDIAPLLITLGVCFVALRLGLGAAGIFKFERAGETLSALALLPKSMKRVAYEKVVALFLATIPGLVAIGLGIMIVDLPRFDHWDSDEYLSLFVTIASVMFGLHLVAYLSLYLRWGAFPIGIMACGVIWLLIFLMFVLVTRGRYDEESLFFPIGLTFSGFAVALHLLIGKRLYRLASES